MRGLLITMEGVEGSGKSTQLERLAERLRTTGRPLTVTKEPGGTALGRELRRLLLTAHASGEAWAPEAELLLFYADRAQHLAQVVRPALGRGEVVLVDRFEDSTRAYQGAQGVPEEALDALRTLVLGDLRPHLTLLLDLDPEEGLRRVGARNAAQDGFAETRFDEAHLEFHRAVRARFLAIAGREPGRVAVIPAHGEPDQVAAGVWARVSALLEGVAHV
jgi:dTMP kinase